MSEAAPKWKRQPDERPSQIVQAALTIFSEKGYRAATMQEVAESAGITKGTIYLYFSSKEELFLETMRAQVQEGLDLLPQITFEPGDDLESLTRRLAKEFLDVLMTPEVARVIPLLIAEFDHVPGLKEFHRTELLEKADLSLARLLEVGMEAGIVKRMDPLIAARCLLGTFFTFVLSQEVFGLKDVTPMGNEDIVETVVAILFRGLLAEGYRS
jgi:AcrR family transcriptional regulator